MDVGHDVVHHRLHDAQRPAGDRKSTRLNSSHGYNSYAVFCLRKMLPADNNTVGMGDAGIKSAIQVANVPNPDNAVPSFDSAAMAIAGKGLLQIKLHDISTDVP